MLDHKELFSEVDSPELLKDHRLIWRKTLNLFHLTKVYFLHWLNEAFSFNLSNMTKTNECLILIEKHYLRNHHLNKHFLQIFMIIVYNEHW